MKEFLQAKIRECVVDIAGIYEELSGDHDWESKEYDDLFELASKTIWEKGDTRDIAAASNSGGRIAAYAHIAQVYVIHLDDEVKDLFKWADVICP
jgi:hypothetical protein